MLEFPTCPDLFGGFTGLLEYTLSVVVCHLDTEGSIRIFMANFSQKPTLRILEVVG
jgi:hypothetical protein